MLWVHTEVGAVAASLMCHLICTRCGGNWRGVVCYRLMHHKVTPTVKQNLLNGDVALHIESSVRDKGNARGIALHVLHVPGGGLAGMK